MKRKLRNTAIIALLISYQIPVHYYAAKGGWRDLENFVLAQNGVEPASYQAAVAMWDGVKPKNKPETDNAYEQTRN